MAWRGASGWSCAGNCKLTSLAGAIRENSVFAWIPPSPHASVSRQALFAGNPPLHAFRPASLRPIVSRHSGRSFGPTTVCLRHPSSTRETSARPRISKGLREALARPKVRVAGLVIKKVDDMMHGMKLGGTGMQNQVRIWAEKGYLADLIAMLLEQEFAVAITSDHGNVEAVGIGRPAEGVLAQQKGQRARIYSDATLRGIDKEELSGDC